MSSAHPSDWQVNARLPTRSATHPASPYVAGNSPRSQDSNGHGTPRADNQSVFAAQQVATPRAPIPERAFSTDPTPQHHQYPSGLRIMPPPPIPPLSPSRQIRGNNRGTHHGAHNASGLGGVPSSLSVGDAEASRRAGNGRPQARSPTASTFLGMREQQSQSQYPNRPVNVPLPPSESSHQEHYSAEMEKREQSTQGDTAVIESVSGDTHLGHRQMTTSTSQSSAASSSQPSVGVLCGACGTAVKGQYVRAMGRIYHLDCFKCRVRAVDLSCQEGKLIVVTSCLSRTVTKLSLPNSSLWMIKTARILCVSETTLQDSTLSAGSATRHSGEPISPRATRNTMSSISHVRFVRRCLVLKIRITSMTNKFVS